MPTTTNYGWTTPADTDLVKDGAAAIRTLGSSIDTTVFNNASAGIPKTIVDAKGDLIAATAADTVARLAVGTNGHVLTADSAEATGIKWAAPASGGMTLLSTTSLSGTSTTISSINQTYTNLFVSITGITYSTTALLALRVNGSTTNTVNTQVVSGSIYSNALMAIIYNLGGSNSSGFTGSIYFDDYSATQRHSFNSYGNCADAGTNRSFIVSGATTDTTAISSLVFTTNGGSASFTAGTVKIYGVK